MIDEKNLMGFLIEENKEIKRDFKKIEQKTQKYKNRNDILCREMVDFELLWSYSQVKTDNFLEEELKTGLHTILSIPINKMHYDKCKKPTL